MKSILQKVDFIIIFLYNCLDNNFIESENFMNNIEYYYLHYSCRIINIIYKKKKKKKF